MFISSALDYNDITTQIYRLYMLSKGCKKGIVLMLTVDFGTPIYEFTINICMYLISSSLLYIDFGVCCLRMI
jgi:hypothetical protein